MNFENAVNYLESFISYESGRKFNYSEKDFNLEKLENFILDYGLVFSDLKFFHVAGSKGKGSVCTLIANYLNKSLLASGVRKGRVGLFTSPHIITVRERICVDGEMISEGDFADGVAKLKGYIDSIGPCELTYFELLFVLALQIFVERGVEYAVLEVGLGGRLDATNIVKPEVCVLSTVELEHTEILGETIGEVLGEKLGIVKNGVPLVVGYQSEEVYGLLNRKIESGELRDVVFVEDVMGESSVVREKNVIVATVALETVLGAVDVGLLSDVAKNFSLIGRFDVREIEGKTIVFDMAHTANSVEALISSLVAQFEDKSFVFLVSVMKGKQVEKILKLIDGVAKKIVYTESHIERSIKVSELVKVVGGESEEDCLRAYSGLLKGLKKDQVLVITGSHFLVGKILSSVE